MWLFLLYLSPCQVVVVKTYDATCRLKRMMVSSNMAVPSMLSCTFIQAFRCVGCTRGGGRWQVEGSDADNSTWEEGGDMTETGCGVARNCGRACSMPFKVNGNPRQSPAPFEACKRHASRPSPA